MATDFVELTNNALTLLGDYTYITALTDPIKTAKVASQVYVQARQEALRQRYWNFALKRVVINKEVTTPAYGTGNYYAKPADFLRLHSINDDLYKEYTIEGDYIYHEGGDSINLKYVGDVTDASKFDSLFSAYYAAVLARKMAPQITDSKETLQTIAALEQKYLSEAGSIDHADNGFEVVTADTFLSYRL